MAKKPKSQPTSKPEPAPAPEPQKSRAAGDESLAPDRPDGRESATGADDSAGDAGMSEQQIRDAGWLIDVPFECPDPGGKDLEYSDGGNADTWTPSDDLKMGGLTWAALPPLDPQIAQRFGLRKAPEEKPPPNGDSGAGPGPEAPTA